MPEVFPLTHLEVLPVVEVMQVCSLITTCYKNRNFECTRKKAGKIIEKVTNYGGKVKKRVIKKSAVFSVE